MRIFIYANESQRDEISLKPAVPGIYFHFSKNLPNADEIDNHEVFFLLDGENEQMNFNQFHFKPVVINSVSKKLSANRLPKNIARINGWPGFLERSVWEIACEEKDIFVPVFQKLNWEILAVKDEPGMVSGRVVSMIINEAFYALKENISTKKEINLAMKLGTNYPLGPFEWAEKIGVEKVFDLLTVLSEKDSRCVPSFQRNAKI